MMIPRDLVIRALSLGQSSVVAKPTPRFVATLAIFAQALADGK